MSVLYFVRHAAAEDARPGLPDADRALTPDGVRKFRHAARGIVCVVAAMPPRVIFTSPLVRARQTAELLGEAFDHAKLRVELHGLPALGPSGSLAKLLKETRRQDSLVVGHEPGLSIWIGELCFGAPGELELKKGSLAAVELTSPNRGRLLYLLQPAILRDL
jgi:phosphohistidine phosphatase